MFDPSGRFTSCFPANILYEFFLCPRRATCPIYFRLLWSSYFVIALGHKTLYICVAASGEMPFSQPYKTEDKILISCIFSLRVSTAGQQAELNALRFLYAFNFIWMQLWFMKPLVFSKYFNFAMFLKKLSFIFMMSSCIPKTALEHRTYTLFSLCLLLNHFLAGISYTFHVFHRNFIYFFVHKLT